MMAPVSVDLHVSDNGVLTFPAPWPLRIEHQPNSNSNSKQILVRWSPRAATTTATTLNIGDSVMLGLFHRGHFHDILEQIFFQLDPQSLAQCSLVCKQWQRFLQDNVLYKRDGKFRLRSNWTSGSVKSRRTLLRIPQGRQGVSVGVPRDICRDGDILVVADVGKVRVFNLSERPRPQGTVILEGNPGKVARWQLHLTDGFLMCRQRYRGAGLTVFDRRRWSFLQPLTLKKGMWDHLTDAQPVGGDSPDCFVGVFDNVLEKFQIRMQSSAPCATTVWSTRFHSPILSLAMGDDKRNAMVCHTYYDIFSLTLLDLDSGHQSLGSNQCRLQVTSSDEYVVKGTAYSRHVGVAVLSRTSEIEDGDGWMSFREEGPCLILLCDLIMGTVQRQLSADLSTQLGADLTRTSLRMWCDPPLGTLLLTTLEESRGRLLMYDLKELLERSSHEDEAVTPSGVVETGAAVSGGGVDVDTHTVTFAAADLASKETEVVELDFWGK